MGKNIQVFGEGDKVKTNMKYPQGPLFFEVVRGKSVSPYPKDMVVGQDHPALKNLQRWLPYE